MPSAFLHAVEHFLDLVGYIAIDAIDDELGIAQDRIERRAQLMAHVGEELRLMLAGHLQFAALLLDLSEQSGILDRHGRLGCKRLQNIDYSWRKAADNLAGHRKSAQHAPFAQKRQGQHERISARLMTSRR